MGNIREPVEAQPHARHGPLFSNIDRYDHRDITGLHVAGKLLSWTSIKDKILHSVHLEIFI